MYHLLFDADLVVWLFGIRTSAVVKAETSSFVWLFPHLLSFPSFSKCYQRGKNRKGRMNCSS